MAMDIEKELKDEKKPDISFLKPKKTKPRSDLRSPFGDEGPAETKTPPVSLEKEKATDDKSLSARNGAEAAKKDPVSPIRKPLANQTAITVDPEYKSTKLNSPAAGDTLHKIVKEIGSIQTIHLLLLMELADSEGQFSKSNNEIADHLTVSKSSVKRMLSDMIRSGTLQRVKDGDPRTRSPATYQLSAKNRLVSAIRETISL